MDWFGNTEPYCQTMENRKDALSDIEVVKYALKDKHMVKDTPDDLTDAPDALDAPETTTTSTRVTICSDCLVCV